MSEIDNSFIFRMFGQCCGCQGWAHIRKTSHSSISMRCAWDTATTTSWVNSGGKIHTMQLWTSAYSFVILSNYHRRSIGTTKCLLADYSRRWTSPIRGRMYRVGRPCASSGWFSSPSLWSSSHGMDGGRRWSAPSWVLRLSSSGGTSSSEATTTYWFGIHSSHLA